MVILLPLPCHIIHIGAYEFMDIERHIMWPCVTLAEKEVCKKNQIEKLSCVYTEMTYRWIVISRLHFLRNMLNYALISHTIDLCMDDLDENNKCPVASNVYFTQNTQRHTDTYHNHIDWFNWASAFSNDVLLVSIELYEARQKYCAKKEAIKQNRIRMILTEYYRLFEKQSTSPQKLAQLTNNTSTAAHTNTQLIDRAAEPVETCSYGSIVCWSAWPWPSRVSDVVRSQSTDHTQTIGYIFR